MCIKDIIFIFPNRTQLLFLTNEAPGGWNYLIYTVGIIFRSFCISIYNSLVDRSSNVHIYRLKIGHLQKSVQIANQMGRRCN